MSLARDAQAVCGAVLRDALLRWLVPASTMHHDTTPTPCVCRPPDKSTDSRVMVGRQSRQHAAGSNLLLCLSKAAALEHVWVHLNDGSAWLSLLRSHGLAHLDVIFACRRVSKVNSFDAHIYSDKLIMKDAHAARQGWHAWNSVVSKDVLASLATPLMYAATSALPAAVAPPPPPPPPYFRSLGSA